jgi:hypothetical protein
VDFAGTAWIERFQSLRNKHSVRFITQAEYQGNDALFTLLGRVVLGAAIQRSRTNHVSAHLLTVQSEIDLKQKKGGTRDVATYWPGNLNHININPDIFLNPTTPDSIVSQPQIIRKQDSQQAILYLAYVGGDETVLAEATKTLDSLIQTSPELKADLVPVKRNHAIVVAFTNEAGALEFISISMKRVKLINKTKTVRAALHLGVAPVSQTEFESNGLLHEVETLGGKATINTILASHAFAALLSLSPRSYKIEQAGYIQAEEQVLSIYTVQLPA